MWCHSLAYAILARLGLSLYKISFIMCHGRNRAARIEGSSLFIVYSGLNWSQSMSW